jgi:amidase
MSEAHRLEPQAWSNILTAMPPALRVVSGDTVVTETLDAAGVDARGRKMAGPPNPMNGPIFVEGAEPGDALLVEIIRIDPVSGTGWTRGALSANVVDPEAARDLPPRDRVGWLIDREAGTLRLEKPEPALAGLVLPIAPMIGCFGVAPPHLQAISTASSDRNGGNMDYRGFTAGCAVSFPVFVPGRSSSLATATRCRATARSSGRASRPAATWRCA